MAQLIKFFLTVCDDKPHVMMGDKHIKLDFRGEVNIGHEIKDNVVHLDLEFMRGSSPCWRCRPHYGFLDTGLLRQFVCDRDL